MTDHKVLVLSNHRPDAPSLTQSERELFAAARSLGQVATLAFNHQATGPVDLYAAEGAQKVYLASQDISATLSTEKVAVAVDAVRAFEADLVLASNDIETTEVLARLSIRLQAGVITDAIAVDSGLVATKNVLGGAYNTTARVTTDIAIISLKPNSLELAEENITPGDATIMALDVTDSTGAKITGLVERPRSKRPRLEEASTVVAAGRGINGDLAPIEALADTLDAAIGATRAVTDAGWLPHETQIGQTGKTVSPQLYLSVGISGALQQKTGMQTSKTIVAINKDSDAPVFEIADFGIVGDLFDVIPQAVEEIAKRRHQA